MDHDGSGMSAADGNSAIFAARQPIVGRSRELVAYELLFRGVWEGAGSAGGDYATSRIIAEAVLPGGLNDLTGMVPACINFTEKLLLDGTAEMLSPPENFVIEVLEDVPPSEAILAECRRLRSQGFRVALDDVVASDRIGAFAGVIDIVKVDVREAAPRSWKDLVVASRQAGAMVLAEKVETAEEMTLLLELGFDYFQGFALGRPFGVAQKPLPGLSPVHARLLEVVSRAEVSTDELEDVVRLDPTLSYRVLAYANSARAAQRRKVDSLRAALVLFGQDDTRRAARLVVLAGLCSDMPEHVIIESLVRSRLCEDLAPIVGHGDLSGRYALCGLLSNLDLMLGQPMDEVIRQLAVSDDIAAALVSRGGDLGATLALVESYESGDWEGVGGYASGLGVPLAVLPSLYQRAVQTIAKLVPRSAASGPPSPAN